MKDKLSLLLVTSVVLGYACTSIPWADVSVTHIDGSVGFSLKWAVWVVLAHYVPMIILIIGLTMKQTKIDKEVVGVYLAFEIYSLGVYLYGGWPERNDLIVPAFCVGCVYVIARKLWK